MNLSLKLELPSDPELLRVIRSAVKEFAAVTGFSEDDCRSITVAVDEALTNIIRHAYQNRHGEPIDLVCRRCDEGLEFILTDRGQPVDPAKLHGRPLADVRPGGLGMHIIQKIMDQVEYGQVPEGNRLRLMKYWKIRQEGKS
ncbi:MAG TPA: ATP-binding protein [Candidatus Acidoferrales bacterium]|nr:ATP-binding protein [Candidatus Acidoferrales bacterium]